MSWSDPAVAKKILETYKVFAVVGCSSDPNRASNDVARFLQNQGYTVVPVNPNETEVLGLECYPDLASVPMEIEVVDIFRRADEAGTHVDEAIAVGAKAVWMQLGMIDSAAAGRASAAGLDVVMDRCPKIDLPSLMRDAR